MSKYAGFFSDLDQSPEVTSAPQSDKYSGFFSDMPEKESSFRKPARIAGQLAIGAAERAAFPFEMATAGMGSPETKTVQRREDIFNDIETLAMKKNAGKITPEEEQELQSMIQEIQSPEKMAKGFKNEEFGIRGLLEKATGQDLKPEGFWENAADWMGLLKNPKKVIGNLKDLKNIGNLSKKELLKKFSPGAEELSALAAGLGSEGGELGKLGLGTGALVFANLVTNLKSGKLMPISKEMKQLHNIGKELGLTDKEMTPIIQSRYKKNVLGAIAEPTEKAKQAIHESKAALGTHYDELKLQPASLKPASRSEVQSFLEGLEDVKESLSRSKYTRTEVKSLVDKIDSMANKVAAEGINGAEIIDTWQEFNQDIDWNSIKDRKRLKNRVKDPMMNLFKKLNPSGAKKFSHVNDMWSRLEETARKVSPSKLKQWMTQGEVLGGLKAVFDLVTVGDPLSMIGILKIKTAKWLATEMLINPHLNGLMNKTLASISTGSKKSQRLMMQKVVEYLNKIDPSEKEEWDNLLN